jgi:hypothetical protein
VSIRRLVLLLTALVVAALAAFFAWVGLDQSGRIATVLAGLVAVAALGVAVWAALPGDHSSRVLVSHSGPARARKRGIATTGVSGTVPLARPVEVEHTGLAEASEGGEATSGVRLDGPGQD